jgi:SMI1 / KNR4 family (SUKH-1)
MKDLLKQISTQALKLTSDFYSAEEKASQWIGRNPATDAAIADTEKRLGIKLPEDVIEFYKASNGTSIISEHSFGAFVPIEKVDWLKNADAYLIECYNGMGEDYVNDLNNSIIISGVEYVHSVLLIQPYGKHEAWRYWEFASYYPGEHPFQGMHAYLSRLVNFLNDQVINEDEALQRVVYLNGKEMYPTDTIYFSNFIIDQATTRNVALHQHMCMKLIFEDTKLKEMYLLEQGAPDKLIPLEGPFVNLPKPELTLKTPKLITFNAEGKHTMGGAYPTDFSEPDHNAISPLQYLGCIRKTDELFAWLPFDLHICFPIYLHSGPLFFDYNNPSKPTVINIEALNNEHSNYEPDIHRNSIIEFEQAKFDFVESLSFFNEDGNGYGNAGLSNYSQINQLPKSPKTGQLMPFVCQLMGGVKMSKCDINITDEFYLKDLQALNFWGDASLMVYCEPSTKTVCCLISH